MAAFGATTSQNLTAIFGSHTSTETVGTLALQYAGLKCTFHRTFTGLRMESIFKGRQLYWKADTKAMVTD